ncbi:MAG: hypothetical protein AAB522_00365 [Patescibacteria group bacterium]
MKDIGKVVATITIWGGVALLSYLFHSFGILSGEGAAWMTLGAFLFTAFLWKL